jgi:maltooligosyltrehalose trehalohydrolase
MIDGRGIGINFDDDGMANIRVWAPHAKEVALCLPGYKADLPLTKAEYGYWELKNSQLKAGDNYWFVLDEKQLPDLASLSQPEGVHGPSQAVNLKDFNWTDGKWKNPLLDNYIIYELHTGTFTDEGTFAGIETRLDYLIELGITAIEIMPVAQFPGVRNWGYDGVFPFAVQNSYGGDKGLMNLVNACHAKGLAVILDVVYNHIGPEGNYFTEFGDYFTTKYKIPWGNATNFDDAWCDAVRDYYIQNALMWFRDFHIDALRMDAVHAIKDFSAKHILQEIRENVDQLNHQTAKQHYLIVELDLNDNRFINPIDKGGYGMDGQWVDEFHHALRVTAGGERDGYYSDFNGIKDLAKSYQDAYVYDGIYSPQRLKTFGNKVTANVGRQFTVFSQNHDQVGNRLLGERSSQLFSFEMQKLMAGAVMISAYLPMLFMGEEWSTQSPFLFFVNHSDKELIAAVSKGRKEEFAAFNFEGDFADPQDEETFNRSKLNWDDMNMAMLAYYKKLIAVRKETYALSDLNRENLVVTFDEDKQTLLLTRGLNDQKAYCLLNFSNQDQPVNFEDYADLKQVLNSAGKEWDGPGISEANIRAQSIIIYTN